MITLTFVIALFFVFLALSRRNGGAALGVLVISMLLWPEFIRVPLGLVQMSAPRFVAFFLLFKLFSRAKRQGMRFGKVDTLVIALWLWTVFATLMADAETAQVTQMIGRGLDTTLMYFIARFSLANQKDIHGLILMLGIGAVIMCAAGVYEAVTWHSPYQRLTGGAARIEGYSEIRMGMLRAQVSTQQSIYFGLAMMIVTGILWALRGFVEKVFAFRLALAASLIAALSSLSSGPWIGVAALVGANLYFNRISWIKPTLYLLLAMSVVLEIVSNRHFYHLIDYFALDPRTAWYRTRLVEIAFSQWQDYWLVGVGSQWPHHWAAMLDGRQHIDVVNNFIMIALYGGLPAMFMYIASHVVAFKWGIAAFKETASMPRQKLLFGLMATLLALDFSSLSVGLFGPPLLLGSILLGLLVSGAAIQDGLEDSPPDFPPRNEDIFFARFR